MRLADSQASRVDCSPVRALTWGKGIMRNPLLVALLVGASPVLAQDIPEFVLVSEFVHQLATMNDLQKLATEELKESKDSYSKLVAGIRNSTRLQLELRRNVLVLRSMKLSGEAADLASTVATFYEQKIALHDQLTEISTEMMSGPKRGVDYGKLAATAPKISATLEHVDKSLFKTTPAFCLILVDVKKTDRQGNLSHLLITKGQRQQLIDRIDTAFGRATTLQKSQNYTIGSAALIKKFLVAGKYKSSDEP